MQDAKLQGVMEACKASKLSWAKSLPLASSDRYRARSMVLLLQLAGVAFTSISQNGAGREPITQASRIIMGRFRLRTPARKEREKERKKAREEKLNPARPQKPY